MISSTSSLASSTPETSANVTLFWFSVISLALALPKLIALPPPAWICRMMRKNKKTITTIGSRLPKSRVSQPLSSRFSIS